MPFGIPTIRHSARYCRNYRSAFRPFGIQTASRLYIHQMLTDFQNSFPASVSRNFFSKNVDNNLVSCSVDVLFRNVQSTTVEWFVEIAIYVLCKVVTEFSTCHVDF